MKKPRDMITGQNSTLYIIIKFYKNIFPVIIVIKVTIKSDETTSNGAVFQITFVVTHSLPCNIAAVELAAGVRNARQQATVTRITGCSASIPFAVQ